MPYALLLSRMCNWLARSLSHEALTPKPSLLCQVLVKTRLFILFPSMFSHLEWETRDFLVFTFLSTHVSSFMLLRGTDPVHLWSLLGNIYSFSKRWFLKPSLRKENWCWGVGRQMNILEAALSKSLMQPMLKNKARILGRVGTKIFARILSSVNEQ